MTAIKHYMEMRQVGLGVIKSIQMANLQRAIKATAKVLGYILFFSACMYLMSDAANARNESEMLGAAEKIKAQQLEIIELRKIAATCLNEHQEGHIQIGDTHYLCSIVSIGEYK